MAGSHPGDDSDPRGPDRYLLNQTGIGRLESRMSAMENRLDGRVNSLEGKIIALRKQLRDDIVMLVGRDTDKSERLPRLEERSKS